MQPYCNQSEPLMSARLGALLSTALVAAASAVSVDECVRTSAAFNPNTGRRIPALQTVDPSAKDVCVCAAVNGGRGVRRALSVYPFRTLDQVPASCKEPAALPPGATGTAAATMFKRTDAHGCNATGGLLLTIPAAAAATFHESGLAATLNAELADTAVAESVFLGTLSGYPTVHAVCWTRYPASTSGFIKYSSEALFDKGGLWWGV